MISCVLVSHEVVQCGGPFCTASCNRTAPEFLTHYQQQRSIFIYFTCLLHAPHLEYEPSGERKNIYLVQHCVCRHTMNTCYMDR